MNEMTVHDHDETDQHFTTDRRTLIKGAAGIGVAAALPRTAAERAGAQTPTALPDGFALVSSLRVPLFSVGSSQANELLTGGITDWIDAGAPIRLPVQVFALQGVVPNGATPVETFADYNSLADALWREPGGVALVPSDQVDFRANVLAVDGFDPIRNGASGDEIIQVAFVGDVVPGRNVHNKMMEYGDFTHPFLKIAPQMSSYDIAIANLEGNLSSNIPAPTDTHTFSFVSDPAMLEGFLLAGIDAVSLANNHSAWNSAGWGVSALLDTIDALDSYGMGRFGAGRDLDEARAPWVTEVKGKRVAIIGIDGVTANEFARDGEAIVFGTELGGPTYAGAGPGTPGTNPYVLDTVLTDIEFLVSQYDIVIPYFHMGIEYVALPPDWAIEGARAAIDVGATMVVTNHPHVIQGMEIYAGKPIVYSVGNFVFDQMFAIDVRQGLILEIAIRGNEVVGIRPRGFEIEDFNQPRLMTAGEHASQMDRFWRSTDRIAAR